MRWAIVAHPDDEIIFAGGAILSHADESWTVVVATHPEGSMRVGESLKACAQLRSLGVDVSYRFLGHADELPNPTGGIDLRLLLAQLARLDLKPGERVYTHGLQGEYGHPGHKAVNWAVCEVMGFTASVSVFSGGCKMMEQIAGPKLLRQKARLFSQCYPSQQGVWAGFSSMMTKLMSAESHAALF